MFSVEVNILTDISEAGGSVLKVSVELDGDKVYDGSCYSKSEIITVGLNVHLGADNTASASRESLVTTIEDDEFESDSEFDEKHPPPSDSQEYRPTPPPNTPSTGIADQSALALLQSEHRGYGDKLQALPASKSNEESSDNCESVTPKTMTLLTVTHERNMLSPRSSRVVYEDVRV
ncbi:MAG: hypothetical protein M1839_009410 [Geoglossum umbratile]|nr:MAG: hypothetical protein M1839_009410 [Geoglossum umbratile]